MRRNDYRGYDEFKKAHSQKSARILHEILLLYSLDRTIRDKVTNLVILHETGGDLEEDILKEADSISFFDVSLPFYFQRNSEEETAFRMRWGYKPDRLSEISVMMMPNWKNFFKR